MRRETKKWIRITITMLLLICMIIPEITIKADGNCDHDWVCTGQHGAVDCDQESYDIYTCTKCGEQKKENVVTYEHDWVFEKTVVEREPSCNNYGIQHDYYKCSKCGREKEQISYDYLEHDWAERVTKEPTCNLPGSSETYCKRCGTVCATGYIPATGKHQFEHVVLKEATCAEEGQEANKCKLCGRLEKDMVWYTDKLPHTYKTETVAATCQKEGQQYQICTVCGDKTNVKTTPKKAHTYKTETVAATCQKEGQEYQICTVCGDKTNVKTIPKKAHTYKTETVAATCQKEGQEYQICTVCGAKTDVKTLSKKAHTYKTETVAATCKKEGQQYQICTICGEKTDVKTLPKKAHSYKTETVAATCKKEGQQYQVCTVCGEKTDVKTLPKKAHTYKTETVAATCKKEGQEYQICTVCGEKTDVKTLPKTDHKYKKETVAATCLKDGQEYQVCSVCNEKKDVKTLPKLGHDFVKLINTKEATTKEEGYHEYKCSRCDETKKEVIPKLEGCKHTSRITRILEFTGSNKIVRTIVCKNCNEILATEIIEKCTHTDCRLECIVQTPANCVSKAKYKVVCTRCGGTVKTDYELPQGEIDPTNHVHLKEDIIKEATYKEEGLVTWTCEDCGYSYEAHTLRLTGCPHEHEEPGVFLKDKKYWIKCADCGAYLRETENAAATNPKCTHKFKDVEKLVKQATATEHGRVDILCSNCGAVKGTADIPPYQEFTVQDENGNSRVVYGYFDEGMAGEVYRLLNEYRKEKGLTELSYNSSCQWASNQRVLECSGLFDHYRPDGSSWKTVTPSWDYGGENLAMGQWSPEEVMLDWKESNGHNANMLRADYRGVSIGCFVELRFYNGSNIPKKAKYYWAQNFTYAPK